jgi:hypothetical protein
MSSPPPGVIVAAACKIISDLLGDPSSGVGLTAGGLVRARPAIVDRAG